MIRPLTERQIEVVRLRDQEGLSYSQIAERLGTTKGGANSSYRAAKAKETAKTALCMNNLKQYGLAPAGCS